MAQMPKFLEDYTTVDELISKMNKEYPECRLVSELVGYGDDWVIYPVDGYGSQEDVRAVFRNEKPDLVWFMTDPRFFHWLWGIGGEIRFFLPIFKFKKEVCLLCLSIDNSLIAKNDFVLELIFLIFISNGLTVIILDFLILFKRFLVTYLFIKNPTKPQFTP